MRQPMSPEDRRTSRYEAVSTVYSRLLGAVVVSFINAALIVAVVEAERASQGALWWLFAIATVSVARAILFWRYKADEDRRAHVAFWASASIMGAFCAGILWGIGPILPFSHFSAYQWLWAFAIGGMCAGAATLHAAHLPTALAFVLPASVPFAVSLLLEGSFQGIAAATMTIAFLGLTTFTAMLFSRDFGRIQALRSALEARALELHEANRRLSREIAEHRSTSAALHQSQKMEALGNLTGGFAHDFNNMLTVIISSLEAIASSTPLAGTRKLANSAIQAAEAGADLISRLLTFARKQTLVAMRTDLVEIVADFRELLTHAVSGGTSVEVDYATPTAPAHVDAAQFRAMLLNLVVNARDAMSDGGIITISVARVTLDAQALGQTRLSPGEFIAVSVADTGEGMSPETLEHAFEPFYTTKGRDGSGLGLAQVYGFARQSGGFGQIRSELGHGTQVTIYLPALAAEEAPALSDPAAGDPSLAPGAELSILLVDDNLAVLHALEATLAAEGWSISCAQDAASALAAIDGDAPFDIVVTDIDMPGDMNGEQLAEELRHRTSIPVLLMSGAPPSSETNGAGPPVIIKPFNKRALIERIQRVLKQSRQNEKARASRM